MEILLQSKIFKFIFFPISLIWRILYFLRRVFYDYGFFHQEYFQVPIISIGNLTFGGTGKTPFTLWLAKYLGESKNKKVMILMRGYKGNLENSHGILETGKKIHSDSKEYGDEALLFSRRLKNSCVVVGKKRAKNLKFYFEKVFPDVVLLDDGHQHIQLKRNLNIVLFDTLMPLEYYQVAPLGKMREGFSALKDADVIILGRSDLSSSLEKENLLQKIRPYLSPKIVIAEVGFRPNGFYNASNELVLKLDQVRNKKIIALAGVAGPKSFYKLLEDLGADVIVTETFPDHHYFKVQEIKTLIDYAKTEEALIVTTEKDIVRINKVINDPLILFLEVDMYFLKGEEETKKVIEKCLYTE